MKLCICTTLLVLLFGFTIATNLPCTFDYTTPVVMGKIYRCYIENNLNIESEYSAFITSASGSHSSGKTNNDVIHFKSVNNKVNYFPQGLEKVFVNLKGIHIDHGQISVIHQSDLRPFPKLVILYVEYNQIEILEDGLFAFNPELESVSFLNNKIFHIGSTVFDSLPKLHYLWLDKNICIDKNAKNDRSKVLDLITSAKNQCTNSYFSRLDEKLKYLTSELQTLTFPIIRIRLNELDVEFGDIRNPNYLTFKKVIQGFWCSLRNP